MKRENTIVLIVDMQNALMEAHPFREEELKENLKAVIGTARQRGIEVIYVRHDGGEGDELAYATQGWQIYDCRRRRGSGYLIKPITVLLRKPGWMHISEKRR